MISLSTKSFVLLKEKTDFDKTKIKPNQFIFPVRWSHQDNWKTTLNNWQLKIQPLIIFWLINPWLRIVNSSELLRGLNHLLAIINQPILYFPDG